MYKWDDIIIPKSLSNDEIANILAMIYKTLQLMSKRIDELEQYVYGLDADEWKAGTD